MRTATEVLDKLEADGILTVIEVIEHRVAEINQAGHGWRVVCSCGERTQVHPLPGGCYSEWRAHFYGEELEA